MDPTTIKTTIMNLVKKRIKGFALLELAIALCVIGTLSAIIIPTIKTAVSYSRLTRTSKAIELAIRSLAIFIKVHDRLPYPAVDGTGLERKADQPVVGFIPYKTLGLDANSVRDGFGNLLHYAAEPDVCIAILKGSINPKHLDFLRATIHSHIKILLEDNSEAIYFDKEAPDHCAAVLISAKNSQQLSSIVGRSGDGIVIKTPPTSSGMKLHWLSRNNIYALSR
jgi:type II secretory pathway pseudopilin PulG